MATPPPGPNRSSVATADTTTDSLPRRMADDILDNDESGNESSTPNGYYLTSRDDSFGSLQRMAPLMSGILSKLNISSGKKDSWNNRHFTLMKDGRLFLFKRNPSPQTLPITFLPVLMYSSASNPRQTAWTFYLRGHGVTADGTVVNRNWSLKCTDPLTTQLWEQAFTTVTSTIGISPTASTSSGGGSSGSYESFSQGPHPLATSRLRSSISPHQNRRELSSSKETDDMTSMQRTKSHKGRSSGLQREIRDVNVTLRHISAASAIDETSGTPVRTANGSKDGTERRTRYFAMPATETEERTMEIVSKQAETASVAAAERKRAIAQRIADSKKAREPQATNILLSGLQDAFKIL
ncbi:hypothetical protein HDU84_008631 [Entophlyctis sp. JEL0112]|nr:hypothetical protein HDU84_008631 [Entophlyctis sp. JEL0112]